LPPESSRRACLKRDLPGYRSPVNFEQSLLAA
jgi:hypothetical protein